MRSLFLLLLLANLIVFAVQFGLVRQVLVSSDAPRLPQLNAEKLRIIRDTTPRPVPAPSPVAPP